LTHGLQRVKHVSPPVPPSRRRLQPGARPLRAARSCRVKVAVGVAVASEAEGVVVEAAIAGEAVAVVAVAAAARSCLTATVATWRTSPPTTRTPTTTSVDTAPRRLRPGAQLQLHQLPWRECPARLPLLRPSVGRVRIRTGSVPSASSRGPARLDVAAQPHSVASCIEAKRRPSGNRARVQLTRPRIHSKQSHQRGPLISRLLLLWTPQLPSQLNLLMRQSKTLYTSHLLTVPSLLFLPIRQLMLHRHKQRRLSRQLQPRLALCSQRQTLCLPLLLNPLWQLKRLHRFNYSLLLLPMRR